MRNRPGQIFIIARIGGGPNRPRQREWPIMGRFFIGTNMRLKMPPGWIMSHLRLDSVGSYGFIYKSLLFCGIFDGLLGDVLDLGKI